MDLLYLQDRDFLLQPRKGEKEESGHVSSSVSEVLKPDKAWDNWKGPVPPSWLPGI